MLEKACNKRNSFIVPMFDLPTTTGSLLTRQQVLFSWVLAESFSPRWQSFVRDMMDENLKRKNDAHEIRDYSDAEQKFLVDAYFKDKLRWGYIHDYIDPSSEFHLIEIPIEALEWLPVLHTFAYKPYPVPLGQYIDWNIADEKNELDPKVMAKRFLKNPPPVIYTGYPLVGYRQEIMSDVLFDGYVRCMTALWRHRAGEKIPPMKMIYCHVPQEKRQRAFYTSKY